MKLGASSGNGNRTLFLEKIKKQGPSRIYSNYQKKTSLSLMT